MSCSAVEKDLRTFGEIFIHAVADGMKNQRTLADLIRKFGINTIHDITAELYIHDDHISLKIQQYCICVWLK